ncbi:DNAJ heat shock family protein [Actinidia rufa]|uniref:DNAJ heat shock family protein n=1 Tax=Actinidia rufa TaxID=165716 RepID=A0A7J0DGF8_9ERIC|nr:DNAJ heat shock family protein [Actinidia rufa]
MPLPPDAGGPGGATFFSTGDGATSFRFTPRNADDIFAEFFESSNPFGEMGGGGGTRGDGSKFGITALVLFEELYKGATKKTKISREIADKSGKTMPVEEILTINIRPGWKKGTKITFPDQGNEQLNVIPFDLVFIIDEKPQRVFTRDGNDLVVTQKIPLADALTGPKECSPVMEMTWNLTVLINNVIHPNYEEVVPREGMPIPKDPSKKGKPQSNSTPSSRRGEGISSL